MTPWQKLFNEARNTSTWKGIFPARREKILYTRDEKVSGEKWIIRDLWIDLQKDIGERLTIANPKPKTVSIFADVVYVPANLSMTLKNMGLIIVARRIEVEEQATIRLDFSSSKGATIMLFTAEIGGVLQAEAVTSNPEIIPITVPQQAGLWIKYDFSAEKAKAREVARLENKLFETGSPLWLMAVSAFQMATVLVLNPVNKERTPEQALELRKKASQMLDFIVRCAKDAVPEKKESAADWQDLTAECQKLKKTLEAGTSPDTVIECAYLYARLLNQNIPVDERQRKLGEVRRASDLRNQAPPYELVETKVSPPKPEDCKYIRHGAITLGMEELNGWDRPVRQVTLSGVEIELDELDRSGFHKNI